MANEKVYISGITCIFTAINCHEFYYKSDNENGTIEELRCVAAKVKTLCKGCGLINPNQKHWENEIVRHDPTIT